MKAKACITSLDDHSYADAISSGLERIDFSRLVGPSDKIFLKPNLTFPTYRQGVMTNPQALRSAIMAIKEYTNHIYIGDSDSGGYNRFSMDEVYQETGLGQFAKENGVQIVNLSSLDTKAIEFSYRNRQFQLNLPRLLTDEIDLLVTMPVPKVHMNTTVSLTFKNQWGCIPEPSDRLRLHPYFQHVVLEVNRAVKASTAIIDGTYGLTVSGPLRGKAVQLNWLMVTDNIGAGARLTCELMQIPMAKVRHLRYAERQGHIPERHNIELNEDLTKFLKEEFALKRTWTDYPGYLAFNGRFFAYLAYFSPVSEILHRLLYLVREPFY